MFKLIGVIGDVHLEYEKLQLAHNYLNNLKVEQIFCTGDIVNYDSKTEYEFEVADFCIKFIMKNNILTVLGNHDDWYKSNEIISPESFLYLKKLPKIIEFKDIESDVLFCHGIGNNYMAKINPDDYGYAIESNFEFNDAKTRYSIIINGHSHRKMVRNFGGVTVINAGTLHRRDDSGFIRVDFEKRDVVFFEFDNENEIIERESIGW